MCAAFWERPPRPPEAGGWQAGGLEVVLWTHSTSSRSSFVWQDAQGAKLHHAHGPNQLDLEKSASAGPRQPSCGLIKLRG